MKNMMTGKQMRKVRDQKGNTPTKKVNGSKSIRAWRIDGSQKGG